MAGSALMCFDIGVLVSRLTAASLSKQEESQLKKQRLTGKYGNSLRSDNRISNPASHIFCPEDRLTSKSFVKHTALRRLLISSVLPRHLRQNKSSRSSCAAGCKGNTETRCAQTTVFLILPPGLAGPADRFARKSFAADAGRGRSVANLQRCGYLYTRHP